MAQPSVFMRPKTLTLVYLLDGGNSPISFSKRLRINLAMMNKTKYDLTVSPYFLLEAAMNKTKYDLAV